MVSHDPTQVTPGVKRLATKILGPCTLVQAAIPDIVTKIPDDYHQQNLRLFHANATHIYNILTPAPGLVPIRPRATMYCMVGIVDSRLYSDDCGGVY